MSQVLRPPCTFKCEDFEFGTPLDGFADAFLESPFLSSLHSTECTTDNGDRCNDGRQLEIVRGSFSGIAHKLMCCLRSGSLCGSPLCHTHAHTVLSLTRTAEPEPPPPRAKCSAPSDRELQLHDKSAAILYSAHLHSFDELNSVEI